MGETERGLQERGLPKAGRAAPRAARPSERLGHVLLAGREEDAGTGGGKESTATGSLHSDPEGPAVVTKKPSGSEHRRRAEPGASIRVRRCRDHGRGAVEALGGPWEQGGASCGCRAGERALQPPPPPHPPWRRSTGRCWRLRWAWPIKGKCLRTGEPPARCPHVQWGTEAPVLRAYIYAPDMWGCLGRAARLWAQVQQVLEVWPPRGSSGRLATREGQEASGGERNCDLLFQRARGTFAPPLLWHGNSRTGQSSPRNSGIRTLISPQIVTPEEISGRRQTPRASSLQGHGSLQAGLPPTLSSCTKTTVPSTIITSA